MASEPLVAQYILDRLTHGVLDLLEFGFECRGRDLHLLRKKSDRNGQGASAAGGDKDRLGNDAADRAERDD